MRTHGYCHTDKLVDSISPRTGKKVKFSGIQGTKCPKSPLRPTPKNVSDTLTEPEIVFENMMKTFMG
jgi:hypothetical protein